MRRTQTEQIKKDLEKKIVFLVGPRQVGKTWLAREIGKDFSAPLYLNYDSYNDRQIITQAVWPQNTDLLILDELHKMPGWKNYLKGIFDTRPAAMRILVTGSARLDFFRKAGDSLAGRFFTHRLLPLAPAELSAADAVVDLERLMTRGGFPEPYLADEETDAARWRNQYTDGLIRTDILDFERIHDFKTIGTIFEILRRSVGSPLSAASIARDVQKSPTTVQKYIQILEALYIVFRVTPFAKNIARAIIKEPKIYFYDTGLVIGDEGIVFENMVALSLLKHVCGRVDSLGERTELQYLRTKEGKEVDFCLVKDGGILQAIEVKLKEQNVSGNLSYFCSKYSLPGIQIVKNLRHEIEKAGITVRRAETFLTELYL